jgi:hypothetical protein
VAAAAATATAFFALEAAGARIFRGVVPTVPLSDPTTLTLLTAVTLAFALVSLGQVLQPAFATSPAWATDWVWIKNGLYANAAFDRLVGALRAPTARASREGAI